MNDEKFIRNLSKLFTNKKFLASIANSNNNFDIKDSYGKVLKYYICTRDKNFDQTYDEIMEKLDKINMGQFEELGLTYEQVLLNSRENGFITSSQNGNKASRIQKYGLNYFDRLDEQEKKELIEAREALKKLEEFLGKSPFTKNDERKNDSQTDKQYFFTTPGPKSIHYALSASPERLYKGPLEGIESFPMIYGEPKKDYYFRFVKEKISKLGLENSSDEIMSCMDKVFEIYCKNPSIIVLLSNKQASDMRFFNNMIQGNISNAPTLGRRFMEQSGYSDINTYFSQHSNDNLEPSNVGNLVTVADQIPQDCISGYITMLDNYEIFQTIARERGAKIGDIITREGNSVIENNDVLTLTTSLKYVRNKDDLEYLTKKISSILDKDLPALKEKYGDLSEKDLKDRIKALKDKREKILDRDFAKKSGIEPTLSLRQVVEQLEKEDMYSQILDDDERIKNDELQYQSSLHGTDHTRRVNFFANILIMRNKRILWKQKDVILAAVKNHDIGRINDTEDKGHGFYSAKTLTEHPERLEGFSEIEKEQILFAIKEHSLTKKENEADLDKLLREKLTQQEGEEYSPEQAYERYISTHKNNCDFSKFYDLLMHKYVNDEKKVMDVLKNADKLDRVRLDPYGQNPREGLDVDRFVGEPQLISTSRDMEYLAYESLNKITELLDTDRELRDLEKYLYLKIGVQTLEENIPVAMSNIEETEKSKKSTISSIFVGGLNQINKIVKSVKEKIKGLFQKRESTGRENE